MYRLSESDKEIMHQVEEITGMDYEIDQVRIPCDYLMNAIKDLLDEIERLNDVIVDMEEDIDENYQLKPSWQCDDFDY